MPFNRSMSNVCVSVEWIFGDIVNYFKFIDFKKDFKIGLSQEDVYSFSYVKECISNVTIFCRQL